MTSQEHKKLSLQDFAFTVPEELVAQEPLQARADSRLLLWQNHTITHSSVRQLADLLPPRSLLIINDTKVLPCRLHGTLGNGTKVEMTLTHELASTTENSQWMVLARPMKKLTPGTKIYLPEECQATVMSTSREALRQPHAVIEFAMSKNKLEELLKKHGVMPLPPYIKRKDLSAEQKNRDSQRYQTVYAAQLGSAAAPTAGLHFNDELMKSLKEKGHEVLPVTLHVGLGTFAPVRTDDPSGHEIHEESYFMPHKTWQAIAAARREGRKVFAVGTTSLRAVESFAQDYAAQPRFDEWLTTKIFIYPKDAGDRFQPSCFDGMLTNFHQPESSLLMLICALLGYENTRAMYATAVQEKYRFFSYGDTSLLMW